MNKKTLVLVLSLAMCCGTAITGCSDSDSSSKSSESSKAETTTAESKAAAESAAEESTAESKASIEEETKKELPTNIIDGIDYLTFVSHGYKLPDDWEEKVEMVTFENKQGYDVSIEKRAYDAYIELTKDLEAEGIFVDADTGYRSVAEQVEITQRYRERYGSEYAKNVVAVPGYSEHHTGLAIDICIEKDGKRINDNDEMIAEEEIFEEIHKHLADHGFILRYIKNGVAITGYDYEPWHFRYVGVDAAKEIAEKKITFEEYVGHLKAGK